MSIPKWKIPLTQAQISQVETATGLKYYKTYKIFAEKPKFNTDSRYWLVIYQGGIEFGEMNLKRIWSLKEFWDYEYSDGLINLPIPLDWITVLSDILNEKYSYNISYIREKHINYKFEDK